jgi:hypothetical protein
VDVFLRKGLRKGEQLPPVMLAGSAQLTILDRHPTTVQDPASTVHRRS